jgi:adenylosuccinate synthase
MPALAEIYQGLEPIYEERPGWHTPTAGITDYDELPQAAKDYFDFLEQAIDVEIGCISTGPERDQTIIREGSQFAKLIQ